MTTPPDRSVEEIVRNWLEEEKKDNYVDIYDLNQVTLDGYFSLSNLIESLTSLHTQGFEAGRRDGTNLEMVKGYNREKEILSNRLTQLMTSNATISTRSSIQTRLREIDEALATLKHPNVITNIHENQ